MTAPTPERYSCLLCGTTTTLPHVCPMFAAPTTGAAEDRRLFHVAGLIDMASRLRLDDEHLVIRSSLLLGMIEALKEQERLLAAPPARGLHMVDPANALPVFDVTITPVPGLPYELKSGVNRPATPPAPAEADIQKSTVADAGVIRTAPAEVQHGD